MGNTIKDRIGSFTTVPNRFLKDETISHEAFRLFVILRMHTNTSSGDEQAFPSYETLKRETGIKHNKTVANALRDLESKGWIDRKKRFSASTVYTLTIPSPDDVVPQSASMSPDDAPVCHQVTRQYVTPSQTNQTNPTRRTYNKTKKIAADAAAIPNPATSTHTQEGTPEPGNSSPLQQSPIDDDVPAAPAPPVVKGKPVKPAPGPRQPDPVFDKLCAMTDSVPAMHGGLIGSTRKKINLDAQHPCTVPNLERFELWWCSTWMSKGDAKPTLGQISQRWGQAQAWADKHAPKPAPLTEQLTPADEAELEAQLLAEMQARENDIAARRQASGWVKTQTV